MEAHFIKTQAASGYFWETKRNLLMLLKYGRLRHSGISCPVVAIAVYVAGYLGGFILLLGQVKLADESSNER